MLFTLASFLLLQHIGNVCMKPVHPLGDPLEDPLEVP